MKLQGSVHEDTANETASGVIERDGITIAKRVYCANQRTRKATRFVANVLEALAPTPNATVVVVPRSLWQYGGNTSHKRRGTLFDPLSGRLCALGWACLSLEVPRRYLADTDNLDTLRNKLAADGRTLPAPLETLSNSAAEENGILDANDGCGPINPFVSEPNAIARSLCEKQVTAAGVPAKLAFVFVDN